MFVTAFEYALAVLLAGYAFLGKGFALLNIPLAVPIYVGELVLALGVLAAVTRPGVVGRAFRSRAVWIYAAFALWGVVETLPYLSYFGLDAVRDAVLYYYGLFMVLTAGVVVRREQMERAARVFARLAPWFLLFAPVAVVASAVLRGSLPSVAGTTPVLVWKPGDVAVHVGMVLVFLLVMPGRRGLDRAHAAPLRSKGPWLTRRLTLSIALCLVALTPTLSSRSALLAVLLGVGLAVALTTRQRLLRLVLAASLGLLVALVWNPRFTLPGREREVSIENVWLGLKSIVTSDPGASGDFEVTKEWRRQWWETIVDETVHGPYFWRGRGFGENLAVAHSIPGFQSEAGDWPLRSPHNAHMTVLSRMGVPGLVLWTALNLAVLRGLWRARRRARAAGDEFLAGLAAWLACAWLMMIANGTTDVYLEGPTGGIWFWSIMGLGVAVSRLRPLLPETEGGNAPAVRR